MGTKDDALTVPVDETMTRLEKGFSNSPKFDYRVIENGTHDYRGFEDELAESVTGWVNEVA